MNTTRPLERFPLVRARDVEGAREAFAQVYSNTMTLQPLGRSGKIDLAINNCQLSQVGLNYTGYDAGVRAHFSGSKFVTLSFPLSGKGVLAINGSERRLGSCCGLVTPAETDFAVMLTDNYEHVVLRIAPAILQTKLASLIGMPVDGPLQFNPLLDFLSTDARLLRDHFFFLIDTVSRTAAPLPELVLAEFEQAVMVMLLHAVRHDYSDLLAAGGPDAAPAEVRRAEDYIAANWQRPIALEDLVAVTGVSALSLFRSFKKHRGYTPMQFAARLRDARRGPH
jgi:hypothetical protein